MLVPEVSIVSDVSFFRASLVSAVSMVSFVSVVSCGVTSVTGALGVKVSRGGSGVSGALWCHCCPKRHLCFWYLCVTGGSGAPGCPRAKVTNCWLQLCLVCLKLLRV